MRAGGHLGSPYDGRGLLTRLSDPDAGTFRFEADALGRPVRRTGPGGAEWRQSYTPEGFAERVEVVVPGGPGETLTYSGHDGRGFPSLLRSDDGGAPLDTQLAYTRLGQLRRVDYPGGDFEEFTYDKAGNRATRLDQSGAAWTYVHDAADQLTRIEDASQQALWTFGHDGAGRRTQKVDLAAGTTSLYTYDGRGRVRTLSRPGYSASFAYGPDGRRTRRTETGAPTHSYPSPRMEVRGASTYRLLRAGAHGAVVAEVEVAAAETYALYRDASQNVGHVVTTDAGGSSSLEGPPRRYAAFGALRSGSSALERGYASQAQEGASGVVWMGARHYDPETGSFLQPDPLGIQVTELYAYARNNPYAFWDPTGLAPGSLAIGAPALDLGLAAIPSRDVGRVADNGDAIAMESLTSADPLSSQSGGFGVGDAALIAGGFVPGVGEALDVAVLADPGSSGFERGAAAVSLGLNALTAGVLPNFGGIARVTTDFVSDAAVVSRGKVLFRGTVDVRPTVEGIQSGALSPRNVFRNDEGLLPSRPPGYYQEFVHPTPGVSGAGPQRIIRGQGGELYYTPDHYGTFIPLN